MSMPLSRWQRDELVPRLHHAEIDVVLLAAYYVTCQVSEVACVVIVDGL